LPPFFLFLFFLSNEVLYFTEGKYNTEPGRGKPTAASEKKKDQNQEKTSLPPFTDVWLQLFYMHSITGYLGRYLEDDFLITLFPLKVLCHVKSAHGSKL
jgi:hypothetical protein